jgi:hypothetical protein
MMTMMTTRFELSLYHNVRAVTGNEHSEEPSLENRKLKTLIAVYRHTTRHTKKKKNERKIKTKPENALA